jgi:hypothetical protein
MIVLATLLFFLAAQAPVSLDQVKVEANPEHRARLAVDYAGVAERRAETAYAEGNMDQVRGNVKDMLDSMELARDSFVASGKRPGRSPGPYKYAEMHSSELLIRLNDLEQKMDAVERDIVDGAKMKVQEIHDSWFEGIMGKSR